MSRLVESSATPAYIAGIRAMSPRSALFLPLLAREQLIGVLSLFRSTRSFDGDDLAFSEDLARLAALALDNARLLDAVRGSLRAQEEMVGVVSHDLRNPVAAIKMLSRALLGGQQRGSLESNQNLALIAEAADQMDTLIRDLLDVNSLDAGKLRLATEPIDASALLTEALRTLQPLVKEKEIALDVQIVSGLPTVLADTERIQQVLSNLVGNAIKFTPKGGRIVIGARTDDHTVTVSVADSGSGINEEHLPKVFDRYWQSTRTNRQGAGLGLAIAKGIVEGHGGRIWIESTAGEGTIAQFTIPVAGSASL
jgi:signal transduction histidine kinase